MKRFIWIALCFLIACSPTVQVSPTSTISSTPLAQPKATVLPSPVIEMTSTHVIKDRFVVIPLATPWILSSGLSIEEHPLVKAPSLEPLIFIPLDGFTQQQILAKHSGEFKNSLPYESYYGLCACTLWTVQSKNKLETVRDPGTLTSDHKILVGVRRDGKVIFSTLIEEPSTTSEFRVLTTFDTHWVLELAKAKKIKEDQQVDAFFSGEVFVDGKSLNELHGYEETFGFQTIHGRPFYFYKKNGKTSISYDGQTTPLAYDGVWHYGCCSAGELNPRIAQNIIGFFAWRDEQWYYVEMGVFDQ